MRTALLDAEVWKEIEGYEGRYEVSTHGRVRSVTRYEFVKEGRHPHPVTRRRNGRILNPTISNVGYHCVGLHHHDKKTVTRTIHRLVAKTFIANDDETLNEVNHIDGDQLNNEVINLEWSNRSLNALHSTRILKKNIGEDNFQSKLTEEKILEIKELIQKGESQTVIGKLFGVTNHAIFRIQHGYNWAWLTGFGRRGEL